jgi:hypothetical protein
MTLRQRAWLPYDVVRTFGPFNGVSSSQFRRALARLHEVDPAQPAVCALDRERKSWVVLGAAEFANRLPDVVVDVLPDSEPSADALTRTMLELDCGDRPIVLGVCGGFVAIRSNHALGDGSTLVRLIEWIAEATSATASSVDMPVPAWKRAPLARAALRLYMRDPMRVVRTLAVKRPTATTQSDAMRAWSPARTFASSRSDADLMSRLRDRRDAAWPGVSSTSIITAAIVTAFEQVRLPIDRTGLCVLVDGRRYQLRPLMLALRFAHYIVGRGRSSTTCFMTSVELSRCTPGSAASTSSSSRWYAPRSAVTMRRR